MRRPLFADWIGTINASEPLYGPFQKGRREYGKMIQQAERFVLSEESAGAVAELTHKEFKKHKRKHLFLVYRELMKSPYSLVWVEMPMTERVFSFRNKTEMVGILAPFTDCGMLIHQPKPNMYALTTAWRDDKGNTEFGMFTTILNLNDEVDGSFLGLPLNIKAMMDAISMGEDPNDPYLVEALSRCTWIPSPYTLRAFQGLPPDIAVAKFNQLIEMAAEQGSNLFKEATEENDTLFSAWLMMLNAKSGTTKVRTHHLNTKTTNAIDSKTGQKRVKVMGSIGYTRIVMDDYEQHDGSPKPSFIERARHMVRGHFKRRSTGIYWWNPFMRGTGAAKERIAYTCELTSHS